jgi:hypothetical protein
MFLMALAWWLGYIAWEFFAGLAKSGGMGW